MPAKPTPKGCGSTPITNVESECSKVVTVPQMTGICWFTALVMSLFFSQHSRKILLNKMSGENDMTMELQAVLWDIMQRRYKSVYEMKDYAYMFFKAISPEAILKRLHEHNADVFNFNPDTHSGYFNYLYLPKLLRFMGANDLLLLDLNEKKNVLTYSVMNDALTMKETNKNKYIMVIDPSKLKVDKKDEYDYVIIYANKMQASNEVYAKNFKLSDTFEHNKKTYVLDSMLMTNFNTHMCNKGHDVCGITCEGDRYIYNGWVRSTVDRSMSEVSVRTLPCELMKYDWMQDIGDFCLNPSACALDSIKDKEIMSKKICFNFNKGERVYVYVNKKRAERPPTPKSPKTPLDFKYEEIVEVMNKRSAKGVKECPPGTELNPKTNRCKKVKAPKECPPGTVLNEKTKRCNKIKESKKKPTDDTTTAPPPKKKVVHKKPGPATTSNDKLYFYSKSKDVAPGKGVNEVVADASAYTDLSKHKDWRKVLSNFHVCPFKYDGYTYNSVEHAFQAKKIALADPDKAYKFTVESGDPLGKADGEAARKKRKDAVLDAKLLAKWGTMKDKVMYDASLAKFTTCPEAAAVLLATGDAQLWHIMMRSTEHVRFEHLEQIRAQLKAPKKNLKK